MIVIDDFVKDDNLLNKLTDPNLYASSETCWWDGESPDDTKKELIQYIWVDHCPILPIEFAGYEYWTNVLEAGRYLHPHIDRDETLYSNTGQVSVPLIGSVYYPRDTGFGGGYLQIYSNGKYRQPEVIEAKYNRLIIFPAGEHTHAVSPVERGSRTAFVTNLWKKPTVINSSPSNE